MVTGGAAVVHEPAEGPLDGPAPRDHLEALLGKVAAGDFDVDAEAGAVLDDLGAVAGIGPGFGDAGLFSQGEASWSRRVGTIRTGRSGCRSSAERHGHGRPVACPVLALAVCSVAGLVLRSVSLAGDRVPAAPSSVRSLRRKAFL